MDLAEVLSVVRRVDGVDPSCGDRAVLLAALSDVRRLSAWVHAREAGLAGGLEHVSSFPEREIAQAAHTSMRDATRVLDRSKAATAMPAMGAALASGGVTGGHVDVAGRALQSLEPALRPRFVDAAPRLAVLAQGVGVDEFARLVRREVRHIEADDGAGRYERQRRNTRLRTWIDDDGMYRLTGQLDPLNGALLASRLDIMVSTLFASTVPDTAPTDPGSRQDHLRALALLALTEESGTTATGRAPRTELLVVIDGNRPDADGRPTVDWGIPVELPHRVLADLAATATIRSVVVRNGVILHATGTLLLGRSTRIANRAQRRALRALHPTCTVHGCHVPFHRCKIHHITWWRHGGTTDLDNLLPVCDIHHHAIHDLGWTVTISPNRTVTFTLPDGTTLVDEQPTHRKHPGTTRARTPSTTHHQHSPAPP